LARPERFELPTPWFVGRFDRFQSFFNQQLAALALLEPSLSKAQSCHSQFVLGSIKTRSRPLGLLEGKGCEGLMSCS